MGTLLKGKPVADQIKSELMSRVAAHREKGLFPKIAIVRVGERQDDVAYENRVIQNCQAVGIETETVIVDNNIIMNEFSKIIEMLNKDPKIHGILIFRPLPEQLDPEKINDLIDPLKDIDCMSPENTEKIFSGDREALAPCTPLAVVEILKFYGVDLAGAHIVIVNRSMVLGKPLAMLLLSENATVTICHSKTKNLSGMTANADIVITGTGKAHCFDAGFFSERSIVVDVGINFFEGKMCGDVDFEPTERIVKAITPVPGGVGAVTSMILLRNVLQAIRLQQEKNHV
jgi:methylenetetrahydrofolate dehydrogenase (NADP+) / methenyltetrahydrofolate cyclohydrolase